MSKRIAIACFAAVSFCAAAGPVTFNNAQLDVTAIALTSGPVALDSQSSPPSATPVVASADSVGGTDIATAGAIGSLGLLTTSADVSGGGGVASAVATSHLSGSFMLNGAEPVLQLDFVGLDFAVGSATGLTSLFVLLTTSGGTTTLFNDSIVGLWSYLLDPGTLYVLDLTLFSEVTAGFPAQGVGNASSFGLVTIASTTSSAVPEPASLALVAVALAMLGSARRRASKGPSTGCCE